MPRASLAVPPCPINFASRRGQMGGQRGPIEILVSKEPRPTTIYGCSTHPQRLEQTSSRGRSCLTPPVRVWIRTRRFTPAPQSGQVWPVGRCTFSGFATSRWSHLSVFRSRASSGEIPIARSLGSVLHSCSPVNPNVNTGGGRSGAGHRVYLVILGDLAVRLGSDDTLLLVLTVGEPVSRSGRDPLGRTSPWRSATEQVPPRRGQGLPRALRRAPLLARGRLALLHPESDGFLGSGW
jgi:hypothetical protein